MPTKPIPELLPRTIEPPEFKKLLYEITDKIEEVVNYGTHIFSWITNDKNKVKNDLDLPIILLLKYALELLDAISILTRQMSIDSCKNLLRILLEIMLYVEYLTDKNTELRSKCYLVCYYQDSLNSLKGYIPETKQYQQLESLLNKDKNIQAVDKIQSKQMQEIASSKTENLKNLLSSPIYIDVVKEYNRLKIKNKQKPKWYGLFNSKVNSIVNLADYLNHQSLYEIVYRGWSRLTHASDVITGQLAQTPDASGAFYQIRMGRDIKQVAIYTFNFASSIYSNTIKCYVPDRNEEFSKWHLSEISPFRQKIEKTKIIVN
jgi:hypothetical protein